MTSIVAKTVVSTALNYISQRVQPASEAQCVREQLAAGADTRRESMTHQQRLARSNADANERAQREAARRRREQLEQHKLDEHPVEQGPGLLRDSLNLGHDVAGEQELAVLLAPPPLGEDALGAASAGLRLRVEDDLRSYVGNLMRPRLITGPLQRPSRDLSGAHGADLQPVWQSCELDLARCSAFPRTQSGCHVSRSSLLAAS